MGEICSIYCPKQISAYPKTSPNEYIDNYNYMY